MKLVIAEKPSVAQSIARVLGAAGRKDGYLKELMKRPDVESLVCATDAGREGELIFRLVYNQCRCKKPFERLWISSMEDAAIRDGFRDLKPETTYDNLYAAALCRERADWIVGMNATRLFSCLYGSTLAVGCVMTPTLGMAVMREAEIQAFKPEIFYEVELHFSGISAKSDRIKEKMAEVDVRNRSAYFRKMALDGYCVNMDFSDIRELVSLLRRCSNNLN